jgi:hypothetical protein
MSGKPRLSSIFIPGNLAEKDLCLGCRPRKNSRCMGASGAVDLNLLDFWLTLDLPR